MLTEGGTFGAYEVRRRLAVGGMGEIYLCRHRVLDRFDAVKVLRPHLADNADFRRRFLREALSAARLRHPNVVTVYTADERDGLLFLAMEYVAGEDLARIIERDGPLDPARVVRLVRVVADALDAAHRAQLVHRDVKPSNLLITAPGTAAESVILVDFGVSRVLDADSEITRTGEIVGTIAYCAPEQLSRGPIGGACDQYALACVAFEALTARVPFPRESQLAIMTAHLTAPPPRVTELRPDLSPAVDAVLARAMAKDPTARYPSCTAFAEAIAAALADRADGEHPAFPSPDGLLAMIAARSPELVRLPADADFGALRLGWAGGGPVVSQRAALMVRGAPGVAAAAVRWLIGQAVARHEARHLCLVGLLAPGSDESWMWVNWLPHARPGNPPLAGPHYATSAASAADLIARLQAVIADRRSGAAALTGAARVLSILDTSLGVDPADPAWAGASALGVDLIFVGAGSPASGMSILELDSTGASFTRAGERSVACVPDLVGPGYPRELTDLLPDE